MQRGGRTPGAVARAVIKDVQAGRIERALTYWDWHAATSRAVFRDSKANELERWKGIAGEWNAAELKPRIKQIVKYPDGTWVIIEWKQKQKSRDRPEYLALVLRRVGRQWRVAGMGGLGS